jgi:uncharacterized membrane protein
MKWWQTLIAMPIMLTPAVWFGIQAHFFWTVLGLGFFSIPLIIVAQIAGVAAIAGSLCWLLGPDDKMLKDIADARHEGY